ncbi:MAG: DNA polymerase III subunit delta' [Actinobacteria bacterium]|jgi:DNA polymerase-3 subunit delta'|nr:DNA polymerase III subunit delta' [Actinomycetota bacterium]
MSVFDQLIDQDNVTSVLKEAVLASRDGKNLSQQMTHAWLFTGPAGSGRSNAAVAFASALVCPAGGCNICNECLSVIAGSHADVELIRTQGLSIKIDEIRELISRASWAPSVANYRVVVIEDADRLTESAANALLKVIEEPGARTVWLLCAPTLADVLPTIRSRCRHLSLHTPSIKAVTKLLIERDLIKPELAEFAARVSQGHIGIARHLATNKETRDERLKTLKIPSMLTDISSAYKAASMLVDAAKQRAESESEIRDDAEIEKLKQAWGATGSKLAAGGSKAIKELEKEQKGRGTRLVRDYLDRALLDLATFYRDVMLVQSGASDFLINTDLQSEITNIASTSAESKTLAKIQAILKTRINLGLNAAPLLAVEALMCELRR